MKAILIDVVSRTVTEVDITGDLDSFYEHIGCDLVEAVNTDVISGNDVLYVDEEGLLHEVEGFFHLDGYPQPLAGNAIIIGIDEDGDSCDCETTVEEVMDAIEFME